MKSKTIFASLIVLLLSALAMVQEIARMDHKSGVQAVPFSSDGRYLARAGGDTVKLWLWHPSAADSGNAATPGPDSQRSEALPPIASSQPTQETGVPAQAILAAKTAAVMGAWGEPEMPGTLGNIVIVLGAASKAAEERRERRKGKSTGPAERQQWEADPATAKQKVEDAIRKWGRFTVLDDPTKADLVLLVVVRSHMKFGAEVRSDELFAFPGGGIPDRNSVALWQSGDTKAAWGFAATKVTRKFQEYVQGLEKKGGH